MSNGHTLSPSQQPKPSMTVSSHIPRRPGKISLLPSLLWRRWHLSSHNNIFHGPKPVSDPIPLDSIRIRVGVDVADSHIQRIVLATGETTVTQQVSHRRIKCQSRLWSQRGTEVNGSHHGDNPLLRLTGIQIATKGHATLQAMTPTNVKTVHQTPLLHIESNLDRLGLLPPSLYIQYAITLSWVISGKA